MKLFSKIDDTVDNYDRPLYFGHPFTRTWYHTFPVLKRGPNAADFIEETPFDPTIRSEFESGAVLTRARFTSVPRKWNIILDDLNETDKVALDSFQRNSVRFGADAFSWENTQDEATYRVRFVAPIRFTIKPKDVRFPPTRWRAEFSLCTC